MPLMRYFGIVGCWPSTSDGFVGTALAAARFRPRAGLSKYREVPHQDRLHGEAP